MHTLSVAELSKSLKNKEFSSVEENIEMITIEQMKKGINSDWPSEFKIVQGPTDEYIRSSKILVTGMSSIALESLAIGIPAIVIEHPEDLPLIPIPDDIPKDMWRYCSGDAQLFDALNHFINIEFAFSASV